MSLINDALKQTKQSQPQSPSANPPPLSPVESAARGGVGWLIPGMVVLFLVAAGIFIGLSLSKPAPLVATALPVSHVPPTAVPAARPTKSATVVTPAAVTNTPSRTNALAVVPPKPREPKLQGILFAATRPCAIVSGKTVFVGDHVGEFRVAAILKDSITLQSETKTNVLSLSPQ